jgi:hypothetical protein
MRFLHTMSNILICVDQASKSPAPNKKLVCILCGNLLDSLDTLDYMDEKPLKSGHIGCNRLIRRGLLIARLKVQILPGLPKLPQKSFLPFVEILIVFSYDRDYLWMRADPPLANARTCSRVAMVVSPGKVVISAPCAQPSLTASSSGSPVSRP